MAIYEFQKNIYEKVKVEMNNYRGRDVIAVWVYYLADKTRDEWKRSPKGIAMRLDLLPMLKKGIDKAYKELKKGTK